MFRAARVFVIAIIVAVGLLGSASIASADTAGRAQHKLPVPARVLDITWE